MTNMAFSGFLKATNLSLNEVKSQLLHFQAKIIGAAQELPDEQQDTLFRAYGRLADSFVVQLIRQAANF